MPCVCGREARFQCSEECPQLYCSEECADDDWTQHEHINALVEGKNRIEVDFVVGRQETAKTIKPFMDALLGQLPAGFGFEQSHDGHIYHIGTKVSDLVGPKGIITAAGLQDAPALGPFDDTFAREVEKPSHYWQPRPKAPNSKDLNRECRLRVMTVLEKQVQDDERAAQQKKTKRKRVSYLAARTKGPGKSPESKPGCSAAPPSRLHYLNGQPVEFNPQRGVMKRDVVYIHAQQRANLEQIDWSIIRALVETGRQVVVVVLYSGVLEGEFFWNANKNFNSPRFAIQTKRFPSAKEGSIQRYDMIASPENTGAFKNIMVRLGWVPGAVVQPVAPVVTRPYTTILDTSNRFGERVRVAMIKVSPSAPLVIDKDTDQRIAIVQVPEGRVNVDQLAGLLQALINTVHNDQRYFHSLARIVDEMIPDRRLKSGDLYQLDRLYWNREMQEAANICRAMMISNDQKKQREAWVWLFHRLFSWDKFPARERGTDPTVFMLQTRTDSFILEFMRFLDTAIVLTMKFAGDPGYLDRIAEWIKPVWPVVKTQNDKIPIHIPSEFRELDPQTDDRRPRAEYFRIHSIRLVARVIEGVFFEEEVTIDRQEIVWETDLPSRQEL